MRLSLSVALSVALAAPLASAQSVDRSETAAMLGWINEARAAEGLSPLAGDSRLDAVAESHSLDMATQRYFSHTSPTTGAPADRAAAAGLVYRSLAENIALNQSVRAAHEALLRSPGHRANLLDGDLRRVGLGIVRGPDGFYVTQFFATFRDESAPAPTPTPARTAPTATPAAAPTAQTAPPPCPVPAAPSAPAAAPPAAPTAAPAAPTTAPAQPGEAMSLPQALGALPALLGLPGWTPVAAPDARPAPRTPARPAATPASPAARRQTGGGYTIPTPFGPIQIGAPEEVTSPWQGAPVDARTAEADDDEAEEDAPAATPVHTAPTRRPTARTAPRRAPYQAPAPPRTTPGRVTTVELPPIT